MKSGSETDVKEGIQEIIDKLSPGRFICMERKTFRGKSAIRHMPARVALFHEDEAIAVALRDLLSVKKPAWHKVKARLAAMCRRSRELFPLLFPAQLQVRPHQLVQVPVQHAIHVANLHARAQVLHHAVRLQDVGANL